MNNTYDQDLANIILKIKDYEAYMGKGLSNEEDDKLMLNGAFLHPQNLNHNVKIFINDPKEINKKKGNFIDSSKRRRNTNFMKYRPKGSFTGRRPQIFELIYLLKNLSARLINIYGPEGIGKTRLMIETMTYLSERDFFKDGMVYIDLKDVETTDAFK